MNTTTKRSEPERTPAEAVQPLELLARYASPSTPCYEILIVHSVLVARIAEKIARRYIEGHPEATLDRDFLLEAALLHDVGIVKCHAPAIGCHGEEPYIRHGMLGREILEAEGLPRHALVCERHTGSGISRKDVARRSLPLPDRDFLPVSLEEKIICVADKFYGKNPRKLWRRRSVDKIDAKLTALGKNSARQWEELKAEFL